MHSNSDLLDLIKHGISLGLQIVNPFTYLVKMTNNNLHQTSQLVQKNEIGIWQC